LSEMDEMPVGEVAVHREILRHRAKHDAIACRDTAHRDRAKQQRALIDRGLQPARMLGNNVDSRTSHSGSTSGTLKFQRQSSATKPEAFTTGPQRAMSARTVAANCAGVWNAGSFPTLAMFSTICGDLTASAMTKL